MGFYSDVYVGVTKKALFKQSLITPKPSILTSANWQDRIKKLEINESIYYKISAVKWYASIKHVTEFMDFFQNIEERCDYGILIINEDDSIEEYGYPYEFNLTASMVAETPFNED